eukprot:218242-Rhodomonas_salina.4
MPRWLRVFDFQDSVLASGLVVPVLSVLLPAYAYVKCDNYLRTRIFCRSVPRADLGPELQEVRVHEQAQRKATVPAAPIVTSTIVAAGTMSAQDSSSEAKCGRHADGAMHFVIDTPSPTHSNQFCLVTAGRNFEYS